jgi:hypothetical protein
MRNITLVSTKDHFLFILTCEHETEEVWSARTEQCISFISSGSYNCFLGSDEEGWNTWSANSSMSSPAMSTRTANIGFGVVAAEDNTVTFTVMAKENAFSGPMDTWTPLLVNPIERVAIEENSSNTFIISDQCTETVHRDIDTFVRTAANTFISDSEVTII